MKCTYRAEKLLRKNNQLKVHSTYRHTVNIIVEKRILAFHRDTIPATPLSVSLSFSEEEFDKFEMEAKRTEVVTLYEKDNMYQKNGGQSYWLQTGSFQKDTGKLILWEDKLKEPVKNKTESNISKKIDIEKTGSIQKKTESNNTESIQKIFSVLLPVLSRNYKKGGFSDCAVTCEKREDDSFITGILREKTAQILSAGNEEDFENEIASLIGLGPGLTPSGDDFITGMFLAFSLCSFQKNIQEKTEQKRQQICKVVSGNLDRTNDISREYLTCAMENRFGELYHMLQKEFYCGKVQEDIFCKIIRTGHSSGIDTLNGFAVGLQLAER